MAMQNHTEVSGSRDRNTPLHDEILSELWETKSKLNREANYSLEALVANANKASDTFTKEAIRINIG
jgi:hypothetical protein